MEISRRRGNWKTKVHSSILCFYFCFFFNVDFFSLNRMEMCYEREFLSDDGVTGTMCAFNHVSHKVNILRSISSIVFYS